MYIPVSIQGLFHTRTSEKETTRDSLRGQRLKLSNGLRLQDKRESESPKNITQVANLRRRADGTPPLSLLSPFLGALCSSWYVIPSRCFFFSFVKTENFFHCLPGRSWHLGVRPPSATPTLGDELNEHNDSLAHLTEGKLLQANSWVWE